jgi:hypothetical protein
MGGSEQFLRMKVDMVWLELRMRSCIVIVGGLELCNTSNVIATSYLDATGCVICGSPAHRMGAYWQTQDLDMVEIK